MTKTVCDKCGKVLCTEKSPKATSQWTTVELRFVQGGEKLSCGCYESFDLCDECKDELVDFVRNKEAHHEPTTT